MTHIQIITPEERLAEPRGVHALIIGDFGIGKTSLLRTLDPSTALFINIENGDLAVHDVPVPHVRPQTWQDLRDLVARIAGPNRTLVRTSLIRRRTSIASADICRASKSVERSSSIP